MLPKTWAVSTGRCNTGLQLSRRRFKAQGLSRALVQAKSYLVMMRCGPALLTYTDFVVSRRKRERPIQWEGCTRAWERLRRDAPVPGEGAAGHSQDMCPVYPELRVQT
jgi:hypothetical protein